jgi:undecaprenyl-diphosphatase
MDTRILHWIHTHSAPWLDQLFLLTHDVGTFWFLAPLVIAMALWHWHLGHEREAKLWILLGVATFALQDGLKRLVGRARPEFWDRIVNVGPLSFPSGHALSTAALFPLVAWDLTRSAVPKVRAAVMAGAILLAFLVGFGRMYLGVHWPSDVMAGWVLGGTQAYLGARWLRAASRKKKS